MPTLSEMKPYSVGVVAEHKELGSWKILATPSEVTPVMDGVLKSNPQTLETKGTDSSGTEYQVEVIVDTTIEATWLPEGSNRRTPPDVRRLERVQLYRFADGDTFYWRPMGLDEHLRRQETVVYVYNNNADAKGADEVDIKNAYVFEISTHTGQITLSTGTSGGELTNYVVQLNAKEGSFSIVDGLENEFTLDSSEAHIFMKNTNGTEFNINKNDLFMKAIDNCTIEVGKTFTIKAKDIVETVSNTRTGTAMSWKETCPVGEFTGVWKVGALGTVTDNGYSGSAEISGNVTAKQNLTVKGDTTLESLTADTITTPNPISAPNV